MSKRQWIYLIGHTFFTFALSILIEHQVGVTWGVALVGATVITLRDLDSLFDDTFGIGGTKLPSDNIDQEVLDQNKKGA